jgi:hypothetical protein
MPSTPFRESRGATAGDQNSPSAASRGRRLGSNARRDIRWAMQQAPHERVTGVWLHGVRITFSDQGARRSSEEGAATRGAGPATRTASSEPDGTATLNSRQRRSRKRLEAFIMAKRAMASRESSSDAGEASAMQLEAHAPGSKDGAQEPPPVPAPSVFVFGEASAAPGPTSFTFGATPSTHEGTANDDPQVAAGNRGRGRGNGARRGGEQRGKGRGRGRSM